MSDQTLALALIAVASGLILPALVKPAGAQLRTTGTQVVSLLKLQDHSVREVAGHLDMSESAVKGMAHRAYVSLRRLLGGRDVPR